MNTTALPRAVIRRMAANSPAASVGVSTAVGSSKIRTVLRRYKSLRISTCCFSPMDSSATRASGRTIMP